MSSHPALELAHLNDSVAVDLVEIYDPRTEEFLTLLGLLVLYREKVDLSFLPSTAPQHLGPGLMHAFARLGGYPRLLEVPPHPPFARRLSDTVVPNPEILQLAHACNFGLGFPHLLTPEGLFGRNLETHLTKAIQVFLPTRGPEPLEVRNQALRSWLKEGAVGPRKELW